MAGYNREILVIVVRPGVNMADYVPSTVTLPPSLVQEVGYRVKLGMSFRSISNHYEKRVSAKPGELCYIARHIGQEYVDLDEPLGDNGTILQQLDASTESTVRVYAYSSPPAANCGIAEPDSVEPDTALGKDEGWEPYLLNP
ncbi:hypothetical protein TWF718_003386 [Orbilia javanica]|uniref:Uncharacterized protein n=1 Tax=Orbilia javanica TaxID=47235 RepID=A0AAN8MLX5_9PEZI